MRIMKNSKSFTGGSAAALLFALTLPPAAFAQGAKSCVEGLWPSAKSAGVTRATFDRAFQGFSIDPEVIEAAKYQPEYVRPIGEYIDRAVSDKRIDTGKQKLVEHQALLGA
ncbi:MAG: lytic murein transglycosylase, partial [Methyloceanibacter sp.]